MSIVIKSSELNYKDPDTGRYIGCNVVAERKIDEQLSDIESKGIEVLHSIPEDYSDFYKKAIATKGNITATSDNRVDLNDYKVDSGSWYIGPSAAGYIDNSPWGANTAYTLFVRATGAASAISAVSQFAISASGIASRRMLTGTWSAWEYTSDWKSNSFVANRQTLSGSVDLSTLTDPGSYAKPSGVELVGLPKQTSGYLMRFVKLASSKYAMYQNADGELWYRSASDSWSLANPGNTYGHSLAGKVLAGVGTSFMKQSATMSSAVPIAKQWFTLIANKYAMTYTNDGLAGCCVAKRAGDSGTSIAERIDTILTEHENTDADDTNSTAWPGETVDYFIIQGGGNDSSNNVPLGDLDSSDDYTFNGALNNIVAKIRAAYPRAKLFYISCFRRWMLDTSKTSSRQNSLGYTDKDYANAMVKNAAYNSIPCFDAWHLSNLMPSYGDSSQPDDPYAWPWISRNNKHLNEEGNARIAPVIAKWLENEGLGGSDYVDLGFEFADNAIAHRQKYRGKYLGSSLTEAQKTSIQNGSFENLWLGDYWTISGVDYIIADFDYWYNCGDTSLTNHHVVVIPRAPMYSVVMNDSDSTAPGYYGSSMRGLNEDSLSGTEFVPYAEGCGLYTALSAFQSAFGDALLTRREYICNSVVDGIEKNGVWADSTIEIPSETMIYGSFIRASSPNIGTTCKTQLALMAASPKHINIRSAYWLRDAVSETSFASVGTNGMAVTNIATTARGVRPVAAIG